MLMLIVPLTTQETSMLSLIFFWIEQSCKAPFTNLKVRCLKSQRKKLKKKNLNANHKVTGFKQRILLK